MWTTSLSVRPALLEIGHVLRALLEAVLLRPQPLRLNSWVAASLLAPHRQLQHGRSQCQPDLGQAAVSLKEVP